MVSTSRPGFFNRMWRVRPRLFNNPVVLRELVERLRKNSSFVYLLLFLFFCMWIPITMWYEYHNSSSLLQWERLSRDMFFTLNIIVGIAVLMLVPLISATSINLEYERKSWELLATTPLSLASIILGKFSSSIFFIWLFLMSLIPIYSLCMTIGGVSPNEIAFVLLIITEIVIISGLFGLYCSIKFKRTVQSISMTYFLTGFYAIGYLIIFVFLSPRYPSFLIYGSPFIIAIVFFMNDAPPVRGLFENVDPYLIHFSFGFVVASIALFACIRALAKKADDQPRQTMGSELKKTFGRNRSSMPTERSRFIFFLLKAKNPVVWKELRESFSQNDLRVLFSLALLFFTNIALTLFLMHVSNGRMRMHEWSYFIAGFSTLVIPCIILPVASNCIRYEFDRETWTILRTTTLSTSQILTGKLVATIRVFFIRFWAFYGLFFVVFLLNPPQQYIKMDFLIGTLLLNHMAALFYICMGIMFSTLFRKTVTAYAMSFAITIFIFIGIPIIFEMMRELFRLRIDYRDTQNMYSIFSPLFMVIAYADRSAFRNSFLNYAIVQCGWMFFTSILFYTISWMRLNYWQPQE